MNGWSLVYEGFNPEEEKLREALCALGNGYFVTRGTGAQAKADGVHYPGTYLAGGYNRLKTDIAGRKIENEDLVNIPNWLPLELKIEGEEWFSPSKADLLSYTQTLDLKRGLLIRDIFFRDGSDRRTHLKERRLVHMLQPHIAGMEMSLRPENWSGTMEIRSALDGRVTNSGVERYKELNGKHLKITRTESMDDESIYLKARTVQSELGIALAARTRLFIDGKQINPGRNNIKEKEYIAQQVSIEVEKEKELRVEKVVSIHTSRDNAISECGLESKKDIRRTRSFNELAEAQTLAWDHLWKRFDVSFQGKPEAEDHRTEMILRLYIFHLLQSVSMHSMDMDVGVPSRGWHGEAYRGHVFWDELYIFPFLNLRVPEITRSLLMYRYRRLGEARESAREAGYRGAMYPWQSGSNGREESQQVHLNPRSGRWIPDNSHLQRHVNAAIAYNVLKYFEVTNDMEFLSFYGAEMVLEIARFWASISSYNSELDRYEITGVMGPDEYHEGYPGEEGRGLNNNAYTNIMAVWVLCKALDILDILPEDRARELRETINLTGEEVSLWEEVSHKMRVVFHGDGIISQFEKYDQLEEFDWEGSREKYGDIQRLDRILEAEGDTPKKYKASKQADVLMLFYLFSSDELRMLFDRLGYKFEYETIPRNIRYYIKRTSHGSTLSRVVHSWVLIRSDRPGSWRLFNQALKSDIEDIQGGTSPEGIHLGAMAGSVNILMEGYTGIETGEGVLWFNPCIPEDMEYLDMRIRYRGHDLHINITPDTLKVHSTRSVKHPVTIGFKNSKYKITGEDSKKFSLKQ